jgi:hypothetical protein
MEAVFIVIFCTNFRWWFYERKRKRTQQPKGESVKIIGIDPGNEETAYAVMAEITGEHSESG